MPTALRVVTLPLGVLCLLAVCLKGTVKVGGAEIPTVDGTVPRIAVGLLGAFLFGISLFWGDHRPKMKTYELTTTSVSISAVVGRMPNGKPKIKTTTSGGHIIEISAASFERSADGSTVIFTDRDGASIQQFRSEHVKHIQLKK